MVDSRRWSGGPTAGNQTTETVLDSDTPQHYIYETVEGCDELEVIREGDSLRLYCRLVMGIPQNDKHYNVLFAFYVDDHHYEPTTLSNLDDAAEQWLDENLENASGPLPGPGEKFYKRFGGLRDTAIQTDSTTEPEVL